jgi:hypothetical protein
MGETRSRLLGDVEKDLLSITAVHPMRADAVKEFLRKTNVGWQIIEALLVADKLVAVEYEGNMHYMQKLKRRLGDGK